MDDRTPNQTARLSQAGQAAACEQVLQRLFDACLDLSRSLQEPERAESLVRGTIVDLDDSIRVLRTVVAGLWADASEELSRP